MRFMFTGITRFWDLCKIWTFTKAQLRMHWLIWLARYIMHSLHYSAIEYTMCITHPLMTKYVHALHHIGHFLYVDAAIAENIYSVVCISMGRRQGWVSWLIWAERNSSKKCPIWSHLTPCPLHTQKALIVPSLPLIFGLELLKLHLV